MPDMILKSKMAIKIQALGAVCEGAAQAALGWPIKLQSGTYAVADLDGDIQVRLIGVDHYGLRVKPKDKDHWRVFGVIIPAGKERQPYRLPGWVYAGEAREHSEWLMNPNNRTPMWAVPQSALRPNNELRMLLDKEGFTTNTDRLL